MNSSQSKPSGSAADRSSGEASSKHQGLHQPADDTRVEDRLENVDLESRGAKVEDHLRNKRGKGVPGGFDDSMDSDAEEGYVHPGAADPPKRDA
jgi:hypothetical protein